MIYSSYPDDEAVGLMTARGQINKKKAVEAVCLNCFLLARGCTDFEYLAIHGSA